MLELELIFVQVKWFKLGLEVEQEVLKLPPGLTAADVVHDYLAGIYKHIMTTLYRRFDQGVMQMTTIDFVLTVPAIWSDAAKKKTGTRLSWMKCISKLMLIPV